MHEIFGIGRITGQRKPIAPQRCELASHIEAGRLLRHAVYTRDSRGLIPVAMLFLIPAIPRIFAWSKVGTGGSMRSFIAGPGLLV